MVVADAELAHLVLGAGEALNKALEPAGSDKLLSHCPGNHIISSADTNSPYWRLIRKGTAPAFKPENMRCAGPCRSATLDRTPLLPCCPLSPADCV